MTYFWKKKLLLGGKVIMSFLEINNNKYVIFKNYKLR
jgi:hypothetical protein